MARDLWAPSPGGDAGGPVRSPPIAWRAAFDAEAHARAVRRIKDHLAAGDTYQVNFTFPLDAPFAGDPWDLFARILAVQRAPHGAFLDLGRFAVASASPELFFTRQGEGLRVRPMKGTAPRGLDLEDDARAAAALRSSAKDRAENLMIVDMLRNDLGRVAQTGSVRVPALFEIERYPTLLQMTSSVEARSRAPLSRLLGALFPCASVTGAPKVRTMEIIAELEGEPRGFYTGSLGWAGPDHCTWNVAIRTVIVDKERGLARYGVGSGIVADSTPADEYAECLLKARILEEAPFSLLETLAYLPGEGYRRLEGHLARLERSARYFGVPLDAAVPALDDLAKRLDRPSRVRLLVDLRGRATTESAPLVESRRDPLRVALAESPVSSDSVWLRHKTTRREVYERASARTPRLRRRPAVQRAWRAHGKLSRERRGRRERRAPPDPAPGLRPSTRSGASGAPRGGASPGRPGAGDGPHPRPAALALQLCPRPERGRLRRVSRAAPCVIQSPHEVLMELLRDVGLAARNLRASPIYSAAAICTLALGIGATSAIFSVVHGVLLRPLPVREPGRLVVCWGTGSTPDQGVSELSYRNFQDWSAAMRGFSQTAAMGSSNWSMVLDGQGEPERLSYTGVSASFFDTLGAAPLLGRVFRPDDDVPNAAPVVVLNHGTWARRFGADPEVVGKAIRLDGAPRTVVGVMPRGFDFPPGAEFWTPVVPGLASASELWRTDALTYVGVLFLIGRLQEGVSPSQAAQELDAVAQRLDSATAPRFGAAVVITPFLDYLLGPVRRALWALFAAVGVLLFLACANVSGLLLTRVSLRRREDAIRLALGATRARVGRLWAIETVLLCLAGGGLGLLSSSWIASAVVALGPDDIPRLADVSIDLRVALFTFVVVSATAFLCAAAPVRQAGRADLLEALHDSAYGSAGRRSLRARSSLLTLQIGLAVTLLVAAGLVVRSFDNLKRLDLGFVPKGVLALGVDPRVPTPSRDEWFERLLENVSALPGVEAAGAVSLRPLRLGAIGQGTWVRLEGQPATPEGTKDNPGLNYLVATPGYFPAMRIALLRGRLFTHQDDARAPRVALVSKSTARRLWPGQDPIGKRFASPTHSTGGTAGCVAHRRGRGRRRAL